MAQSAKLTSYTVHPDQSISIVFSDGSGRDFASRDDLVEWANATERLDPELAMRFLIAWWWARDDDFSNQNLAVGKTLTFDLSLANPIRVQ